MLSKTVIEHLLTYVHTYLTENANTLFDKPSHFMVEVGSFPMKIILQQQNKIIRLFCKQMHVQKNSK